MLGFQAAVFTGNVFNSRREYRPADTVVKIVHVDASGAVLEHQPEDSANPQASVPAERIEPVDAEVRGQSLVQQGLKQDKPLEYADSRRAVGDRIDAARIKSTELFKFDPKSVVNRYVGYSVRLVRLAEEPFMVSLTRCAKRESLRLRKVPGSCIRATEHPGDRATRKTPAEKYANWWRI